MEKIIIKVNGMVCGGCEKRVKNALENIEEITKKISMPKKNICK